MSDAEFHRREAEELLDAAAVILPSSSDPAWNDTATQAAIFATRATGHVLLAMDARLAELAAAQGDMTLINATVTGAAVLGDAERQLARASIRNRVLRLLGLAP